MARSRQFPIMAVTVAITIFAAPVAQSGQIESACRQSDRPAAGTQVCHCIQQVADRMLTRRDQKLAATFFKDPHKAQEIRMSDNRRDERFWDRYTQFGSTAAITCR